MRLFFAAVVLCALTLSSAPASAFATAESATLANGMEIVVIPDRRAPVVTHMVWYRVGSADEPEAKSGIAHFLEHLMFKGTGRIPPGEFSKIVARLGGEDNAFTSTDYTAYFQRVAPEHLRRVMELEADRMTGLRLTDDVVLPERDVILEERRQRTDSDPGALFGEQMRAALFQAHPYGIPVIGWEHEMRTLTRADALAFYKTFYAPNNAILVVAGDVTLADVKPLAEATYGRLPKRTLTLPPRPQEPPQRAARRIEMTDARVQTPQWSRSYLVPSDRTDVSDEALALDVFADALGGGETSRLYRALVVDQKIAANAGAYNASTARDDGMFGVWAVPAQGADLAELEAAVDAVLAEALTGPLTEGEVARAKTQLVASAAYARDSQQAMAQIYGLSLAIGLTIRDVESWPNRVRSVTGDAALAAARKWLRPERSVTGMLRPATGGAEGAPASAMPAAAAGAVR